MTTHTGRDTASANSAQSAIWNGAVGRHWAEHHTRYDAMLAGVNDALFQAAAITDCDRVLDIGCGTGATTREAARRTPNGHAVGVDISAPLLARARSATDAEGVRNVSYELGDAQTHAFPKAGYDVAVSRGGVMFFADHRAAFTNVARALRPGGRLAFICPQTPGPDSHEARVMTLFQSLLDEETEGTDLTRGTATTGTTDGTNAPGAPRAPRSDASNARGAMTSLAEPVAIRRALAGFSSVRTAAVRIAAHWGKDPAAAVEFVLSRTPDRAVPGATRDRLARAFEPYASPSGIRVPASVWLVTAVRPH
ncbi:putative methyltransferase YcgJ [Streptomyces sp. YIM 130001]|uniref:class I SAM-dependent methyltransferase n=1 Tax=Streptomyces sp. YIM 130001 TaxID=2259644 RepID=UPI000EBD8B93|nr:class I SAM-dependent methyltransferase [Streptomyces sp. YIM 130001]RII09280.1 putative methyltransferase YcgJ [Streptomyces sp. YIM 130001]